MMQINNNGIIHQQNNYEMTVNSTDAAKLFAQINTTLQADHSLTPLELNMAKASIEIAERELKSKTPSQENIKNALDVVKGIGSISELVTKLIALFW